MRPEDYDSWSFVFGLLLLVPVGALICLVIYANKLRRKKVKWRGMQKGG